MRKFDFYLARIINDWVCRNFDGLQWMIFCWIGKEVLDNRVAIREVVRPYLCNNHRKKRQYDLASILSVFHQFAGWQSAKYDMEKTAIEEGNYFHFVGWGSFGCISMLIES